LEDHWHQNLVIAFSKCAHHSASGIRSDKDMPILEFSPLLPADGDKSRERNVTGLAIDNMPLSSGSAGGIIDNSENPK
jgi:hypothetical protein